MSDSHPHHRPHIEALERDEQEGGLSPPPGLSFWRRVWWWFDFLILVKLARLRFIAILVVIGVVITQWDTLVNYYERWTHSSHGDASTGGIYEWFCPMHPSVIRSNGKEKCPICFMPLSRRVKGESHTEALPAGVVSRVQLSPYRVVLAGVQTFRVEPQALSKTIRTVGYVEFNERGQKTVSARVAGRLDEVFANETGRMVKAGDPLAQLYSPELLVTMQNLLEANRTNRKDLADSSRTRLRLLGIEEDQINAAVKSGKASTDLTIRSPISGHIIRKHVIEGQYVQEGSALFDLADLSTVWIQAQVYEDDLPFLPVTHTQNSAGTAVEGVTVTAATRAAPNEPFEGKLTFIYPHVDQTTRTATVRFEVENREHRLRPGATADITLRISADRVPGLLSSTESSSSMPSGRHDVLAIPESSIIDTGHQKVVYREASPGVFEGIEVTVGSRMENEEGATFYPVLAGLSESDRVVTNGSFLVDAETRLNPAAGSIYLGGSGASDDTSRAKTVRPSTPEDPDANIKANLAKLSAEDRALAEEQRFCPVRKTSRLGSMGVPLKLSVEGQTVFVCCAGCKGAALANPKETLETIRQLKERYRKRSPSSSPGAPSSSDPMARSLPKLDPKDSARIAAALAKLSPADRLLAEKQQFCVVTEDGRLGSMGVPVKLSVEGQTVFLCCEGCRDEALKDPRKTLSQLKRLVKADAK